MKSIKKKYIFLLFIVVSLSIFSCIANKSNKEYANDYLILSKTEYAKKYLTLYNLNSNNNLGIKLNEAYLKYCNNNSFQIVVFAENNYVYQTMLINNISMLNDKIPRQKLYRGDYFKIENDILKLESVNVNINSVIEEGKISNDTILMDKEYLAKQKNKVRRIKIRYELIPKIKVYKFDEDNFIIESK